MKSNNTLSQSDNEWFGQNHSGYSNFDYKRVLSRLASYWYVIVLSLLLGSTTAYLINRYTTKVFTVKSSIIIKGNNERIGADFLYGNPLIGNYRSYDNELFLLKSYPLIQSVIEDLNFTVVFYKEGNVKTSEIYERIPIEVIPIDRLPYGETFRFKLTSQHQFSIAELNASGLAKNFDLGDTIHISGFPLVFNIKPENGLSRYLEEDLLLSFFDPLELTKQYERLLTVSWAGDGASVINLEINGTSPEKQIDFLERLVNNYQIYDLSKKNFAATKSLEFIDNQLMIISDSLKFFENQLEKFKNKNTLPNLSDQGTRLYEKLEKFESARAELIIKGNYYDYLESYIKDDANTDQIILPNTVGISDPVLSGLVSQMVSIQMDLKLFSGSGENPLFQDMRNRIMGIRGDILESLRNVRATDQIRSDFLKRDIGLIEAQLQHIPTVERELVAIKRNYSLSETLYLFLMQKRAEAGITKASTISDISIVNPAIAIGGPISPKVFRNYIIAIIISLILPILTFAAIEYFNDKVQSREDIEQVSEIPFIGGIGHHALPSKLAVANKPKSAVSEAFRALRSNLTFFTEGKQKCSFMVTSSLSGEGKTFTTINLATILAMSGRKTIIIGADMRKPRIYDDFDLTNDFGLSNYLVGTVSVKEIIQKTNIENLFLLAAGPIPPNPSELLLNLRFEGLITEIFKDFDFVIIDTPPVGLVTDAFVISSYVDHTLFVVRQNYTPKHFLRSINDYYRTDRISKISIVLNDIQKSGYGYGYGYGYNYGYGYGYGQAKGYYEET